jgi:hypothetical protein
MSTGQREPSNLDTVNSFACLWMCLMAWFTAKLSGTDATVLPALLLYVRGKKECLGIHVPTM